MTTLLYPRLARERGRPRIEELRGRDLEGLQAAARPLLDDHTFAPIGGRQVSEEEIVQLRSHALEIADGCGFPDTRVTEERIRFDKRIGAALHERMGITPHQAADEEIWTHLTLGPLIDLAAWRFEGLPDDRVLGRPRNTFRRLWWRAEILGPLSWDEEHGLAEDETVQIMERPELSGAPHVARALARAFQRRVEVDPATRRMELMREALKRVIRLTPFLRIETLALPVLGALLDEVFLAAAGTMDGELARVPIGPNGWETALSIEDEYVAETVELSASNVSGVPSEGPAGPAKGNGSSRDPNGSHDATAPLGTGTASATGDGDSSVHFDDVPLGLIMQRLVEAVGAYERVDEADLADALADSSGIEVPRRRRRLIGKLAWSAKGRGTLVYDEDEGVWSLGAAPTNPDDRFGEWTLGALVARAEVLLAADPDPFEQLLREVAGAGRAPRVVASVVGSAINEAKSNRRRSEG